MLSIHHITLFFSILLACLFITTSAATEQTAHSKGLIKETMDASGYTYILLDSDGNEQWIAIPQTSVSVGEEATFSDGMVMDNFYSKTLDKTFDNIIFASGLAGKTPKPFHQQQDNSGPASFADAVKMESKPQPVASPQRSGGSTGATVPYMETKVEKVGDEGGYTIEELFAEAKTLDGQNVKVRGKVVKFSPNIMGKNWIHLQDGTGDPMKNTHDLVVTTQSVVESGQVTTVSGKLTANKDFGFGYKYIVLIEEATLVQ